MATFDDFEVLTFDCYGTLIDWETGILKGIKPILARHGVALADKDILEMYAQLEHSAESETYLPYKEILQQVAQGFSRRLGFTLLPGEEDCLWQSIAYWQPFEDTVAALIQLKRYYRLAVVSNIDDDLFAHSLRFLQVPFDEVVTAAQVKSYKPAPDHFREVMARLSVSPDKVLHVAQSLFHDIVPAKALGLTTVWVNRRKGQDGFGATVPAEVKPDFEVVDLRSLVELCLQPTL